MTAQLLETGVWLLVAAFLIWFAVWLTEHMPPPKASDEIKRLREERDTRYREGYEARSVAIELTAKLLDAEAAIAGAQRTKQALIAEADACRERMESLEAELRRYGSDAI